TNEYCSLIIPFYINKKFRRENGNNFLLETEPLLRDISFSKLKPILKDTYGVLLYEEQAMRTARIMADA
ncbi:MAG: hypothetical protein GXP33_11265, partial [Spirochaetes bacterium]|nr:hypothetical protein [Spirochaetota bacterium]